MNRNVIQARNASHAASFRGSSRLTELSTLPQCHACYSGACARVCVCVYECLYVYICICIKTYIYICALYIKDIYISTSHIHQNIIGFYFPEAIDHIDIGLLGYFRPSEGQC